MGQYTHDSLPLTLLGSPGVPPWTQTRQGSSQGGGYGRDIDSYTVYTSGIEMKIDDARSGQRLFEGKAQAASTSNRLQYLVPNLVEAMFTDFPGNSGETVRISIAPEDGRKTVKPVRDQDRPRY